MGSIVPFVSDGTFGPDDIAALSAALDRAMASMALPADALFVKAELAQRIITAAQGGMRDPDLLAAIALGERARRNDDGAS